MHILFVCTGNTCRSPMCEAYFRYLCEKARCHGVTVGSAGVFAGGGAPASENCIRVMRRQGIEMDHFRNTQLTEELLAQADIIIAMTQGHKQHIAQMAPQFLPKIKLLMEFADSGTDVEDPFGGNVEDYLKCFNAMKKALDNLFLDLCHHADN